MKQETKSVVVVGAGPAGYPAAFHAADLDRDVTLVDVEPNPGGVCLYRGCIPSKALLHVAGICRDARDVAECGVHFAEPDINLDALRDWKDSVVGKLTGGLGQLAGARRIRYLEGTAEFRDETAIRVRAADGDTQDVTFDAAIVASGSVPGTIPGFPNSPRVWDSTRALELPEIPERLLVIGGGYIGLELGQVYAALGAGVSVVEMTDSLLPGADPDLVAFLKRGVDHQFDAVMLNTRVAELAEQDNGVSVTFEGATESSAVFDRVLVAVGRKPVTDNLGLEKLGITISEAGFIDTDDQRRTGRENIFAIGDVAGQPMLAHKATYEGRVAAEAICGRKTAFDARAIPAVVFTDPEIAWCGLSEAEARQQGLDIHTTVFPWSASGRATTLGRNDGMTKLILEKGSDRVLGLGLAGHGAGELIAEGVLAVEMGAVAEDLALSIHPHPTLSETIMEAAEAAGGLSTHFLGRKGKGKK